VGKIKAVFIDRDGTINLEKNYVHRINDFELISGALEALKLFVLHGIEIYIITNQAGIAKGYFTENDYYTLTNHMLSIFEKDGIKIEDVLHCPHHPNGIVPEYTKECLCRKPNTKMIEDVIEKKKFIAHELALIGDKSTDIEAGLRLWITTYIVLTGYGKEHCLNANAIYIKADLLDAARHIVNEN